MRARSRDSVVDAPPLLVHGGVERARRHAEIVVAVVGAGARQIAQGVAAADIGDGGGAGAVPRRERRRGDHGHDDAQARAQARRHGGLPRRSLAISKPHERQGDSIAPSAVSSRVWR